MSGTLEEMRDLTGHYVNAHRHLGAKHAIWKTAQDFATTPRRVLGVLRGEVKRVWADELETARRRYLEICELEAQRLEHQAALFRARREDLARRLSCDTSG